MNYRKLPGGYSTLIGGGRLYLAEDHLLMVQTYPGREHYRRYYFRDIQSLTVAAGPRIVLTNRSLVLGLVIAVSMAIPRVSGWAMGLLVLLILTWLLVGVWKGCRCRISTAVSSEDLPVRRTWSATKLLEIVEPLIRAAQADVDMTPLRREERMTPPLQSEAEEAPRAAASGLVDSVTVPPPVMPPPPPAPPVTLIFALTLAVAGAVAYAQGFNPGPLGMALLGVLILTQLGLAIAIMIYRHRRRLGSYPQFAAIAYLVLLGISANSQVMYSSFTNARQGRVATLETRYRTPDPLFWKVYGYSSIALAVVTFGAWLMSKPGERA